jgi:hypothetical protein
MSIRTIASELTNPINFMPSSETVTIITSVYAAVISSAALGWNIYDAAQKNKGKLKVDAALKFLITSHPLLETTTEPILSISVTNRGLSPRHIERPIIHVSEEIEGKKDLIFVRFDDMRNFPFELASGKQFIIEFKLRDLNEGILSKLPRNANFQIVIKDTHGKRYYSKRIAKSEADVMLKIK